MALKDAADARLFDDDLSTATWRRSSRHAVAGGAVRYLRASTGTCRRLAEDHGRLRAEVRLVWGADDRTFPVERARAMAAQFAQSAGIHEVPGAALLVHEEKPDEVAREVIAFLA